MPFGIYFPLSYYFVCSFIGFLVWFELKRTISQKITKTGYEMPCCDQSAIIHHNIYVDLCFDRLYEDILSFPSFPVSLSSRNRKNQLHFSCSLFFSLYAALRYIHTLTLSKIPHSQMSCSLALVFIAMVKRTCGMSSCG